MILHGKRLPAHHQIYIHTDDDTKRHHTYVRQTIRYFSSFEIGMTSCYLFTKVIIISCAGIKDETRLMVI